MAQSAKEIVIYALAAYLSMAALNGLVGLLLPVPAEIKAAPALEKTLKQQDVSLDDWQKAAERVEEKRKLALS
jgi:hypothetical protein